LPTKAQTDADALPTTTPSITPTATLDAQATILALRATTAANEAAAQMAALDAERIRATEAADRIQATQQAEHWQATATVSAEATTQAHSLEIIYQQADVLAELNRAEELRQADARRFTELLGTITAGIMAILAAVAVLWAMFRSWQEKRATSPHSVTQGELLTGYDEEETPADEWENIPYRVGNLTRARMAEIFVHPENMVAFAVGIASGQRPSHNAWVRDGGMFTEQEFTALQDKLVLYGLAEWLSDEHRAGLKITERGMHFLSAAAGLVASATTPPTGYEPLPPLS
jgi:hypothetical protein